MLVVVVVVFLLAAAAAAAAVVVHGAGTLTHPCIRTRPPMDEGSRQLSVMLPLFSCALLVRVSVCMCVHMLYESCLNQRREARRTGSRTDVLVLTCTSSYALPRTCIVPLQSNRSRYRAVQLIKAPEGPGKACLKQVLT